jgi:hypothetical protein
MPLLSTYGISGSQAFGNRGLRFGGSAFYNAGGDRLIIPANTAAFSHTGNFTVEMYIYPTTISGTRLLWRQGTNVYMWLSNGQVVWYHGTNPYPFSSIPVNLNQWNHIAAVRNAGVVTMYVNGVGSGAVFNNNSVGNNQNILVGSWDGSNLYQFLGYITNVRVAKQALYTSNFTPSSIPLTRVSQGSTTTTLLLNMRSASTLNVDSGPNNFTVTNFSVTYDDFNPFAQPYVTPPAVVIQSATVTPSTFTPSEGTTITFTVSGSNTPDGTYFYTIEEDISSGAVTASDFTPAALSGSFTMTSNSGSFTITVANDLLTEGEETFVVYVRKDSTSGAILGTSGNITITDSSITPVFTATPASINEGSAGTFTVANVGVDGTYFFTVENITTTNADFVAASGSFTVSGSSGGIDNGTGSFTITPNLDRTTEGAETFRVQVRSGSTSGPVIITSNTITINDTSLTPAFTSAPNINEGSSATYSVNNLGPAGTYFWTIQNVSTTNADFASVSGSFTTSTLNGTGSFSVTTVNDYTTEGNETFRLQIRTESTSGTVILTSGNITLSDTSQTVTATPSSTFMTEGDTISITASSTSTPNGTYYWTINHITTDSLDFVADSGSFTINSNSGSFFLSAVEDFLFEGDETFQVQIRINSTSGTVIATTDVITLSDSFEFGGP